MADRPTIMSLPFAAGHDALELLLRLLTELTIPLCDLYRVWRRRRRIQPRRDACTHIHQRNNIGCVPIFRTTTVAGSPVLSTWKAMAKVIRSDTGTGFLEGSCAFTSGNMNGSRETPDLSPMGRTGERCYPNLGLGKFIGGRSGQLPITDGQLA